MPELRQNPVSGSWAIIAKERAKRPSDFTVAKEDGKESANCPFCVGNEQATPPEVMAYRDGSPPDSPGWSLRVVPNKFPALAEGDNLNALRDGIFYSLEGIGVHEVIVESTYHNASFPELDPPQAEQVIRSWRERYHALKDNPILASAQLFKNQGRVAGASLEHPHSQLIATPMVPPALQRELENARTYWQKHAECLFCQLIRQEQKRLVLENNLFVAFCPWASRFPFETWILPKEHQSEFDELGGEAAGALASLLQQVLGQLANELDNPPFNLVLHSAPFRGQHTYYHWHLELLPRLTTVAGFEWGTECYINPTPPEEAARYLREAEWSVPLATPVEETLGARHPQGLNTKQGVSANA